jgi:hypothetical protein
MVCAAGIMQVCNVSQQQPLHSLKVGSTPAQSLNFFPGSSRALITFQDGSVSAALSPSWDAIAVSLVATC